MIGPLQPSHPRKTYRDDEVGAWIIFGDDANTDIGGSHRQPILEIVEGSYGNALAYARELRGFFIWGEGTVEKFTYEAKYVGTTGPPPEPPITDPGEMVRKLEWSGKAVDEDGRFVRACPLCGGIDPHDPLWKNTRSEFWGHRDDCSLGKMVGND